MHIDIMTLYKLILKNRNETTFTIIKELTNEPIEINNFNPFECKLFNEDVFTFNRGIVDIVSSKIRTFTDIPGVLILAGNKTYGRERKPQNGATYTLNNFKKHCGKLLYKCIPNDPSIPCFLIPYDIKDIGFSKVMSNMYITFRFTNWNEKHPRGVISQIIGDINSLDCFYEYQLYCKNLQISFRHFNKVVNDIDNIDDINDLVDTNYINKNNDINDRTKLNIFTIDSETTEDYDDALGIVKKDDKYIISIYISNVPMVLDKLNLWSHMTERTSSIYLPNCVKPMLPKLLSNGLCSLKKNKKRLAFVMDIIIQNGNIIDVKYNKCLIKVSNNFVYESDCLLSHTDYKLIYELCRDCLSVNYRYLDSEINNSTDLVTYLMLMMNHFCGKLMREYNNGICRANTSIPIPIPIMASNTKYALIDNQCDLTHTTLGLDIYIHITSPIRRIVDLLNMLQLQINLGLVTFNQEAIVFYNKWIQQLDYINVSMRSIKKIQNECALLDLCINKPETLDNIYDGICFKDEDTAEINVYIPELKLTNKIITDKQINNMDKCQIKLYLFNNEEKFKKKIRFQLLQK